jgi:hypothetical protein
MASPTLKRLKCGNLDATPDFIFEMVDQGEEVKAEGTIQIDQQVHVATRARMALGKGPVHGHALDAVTLSQDGQLLPQDTQ